jgi:FkbM family methyltransferase
MKQSIKRALARLGWHVSRVPPNRFEAMEQLLGQLQRRGYVPRVIIDGGSNFGQFAAKARRVYPEALLHLVEPQPECADALEALVRRDGRMRLHRTVLTRPGVDRVRMVGTGADGGCSGAWVAREGEALDAHDGTLVAGASTLDALFADVVAEDRALLKLDIEGHEVEALSGGARLLDAVEVVVSEVQFFEVLHNGRPCFTDLLGFLEERGFELYDIAALASRARDGRLCMGDAVFARRGSALVADVSWD